MVIRLDEIEARVLGALVEKSLTTPDLYPLTLNGLINACNQKTSREPVLSLDEPTVGKGLHSLIEKSLAGRLHEPGGRVPKFMHHIEFLLGTEDAKTVATICVLLLRGPQTPGEIKTRTDRLCRFTSSAEVESLLQDLAARPEPFVVQLPRRPGQKEARYRQLFSGAPAPTAPAAPAPSAAAPDRLTLLESRVDALEKIVEALGVKTAERL